MVSDPKRKMDLNDKVNALRVLEVEEKGNQLDTLRRFMQSLKD